MLWTPSKGMPHEEVASVSCTTGASATTKGTPAQLIASTARDAHLVVVGVEGYTLAATASEMAMDLLIGASTESVLIANLLGGYGFQKMWCFPLYVPAGNRLAVQAAGAMVSTAFTAWIRLLSFPGGPPFPIGGMVTTYGMGTVPNGASITPGASGAEGAWAQMTASTTDHHMALVPSFQLSADTTTNSRRLHVDLGIGAATEEVVASEYVWTSNANEEMAGPMGAFPAFGDFPSGSRLTMRCSNSGANDGAYNGVIHAVS